MKYWICAAFCFCIGCLVGFFAYSLSSEKQSPTTQTKAIRQTGALTNPLLECEIGDQESFKEIKLFREKLQAVVDKHIAFGKATYVSLYFRDLNNGPWMGINEKEEFSPSSLLKVPLMMAMYKLAEKDASILDTKALYNGTDNKDLAQNVQPSIQLLPNQSYTYQELIERMIAYSDNNATVLLSKGIQDDVFLRPYEDLGITPPLLKNGEYYLRVKDYATFFRVLFNASYLSREYSEKALGVLLKSEYQQGLVAGIPADIRVAHKFGERIWSDTNEHQLHDCGIVYYPNQPYLLCVMTRGKDFTSLGEVIAAISTLVYKEVQSQIK